MSDLLRRWVGRWWWLEFGDTGRVGPMGYKRANRWREDAPLQTRIVWNKP